MRCTAVWKLGSWRAHSSCNVCSHAYECHADGTCHVRGCPCSVNVSETCDVEVVASDDVCLAEGCWARRDEHCDAPEPNKLHLCADGYAHHAFVPAFKHVGDVRWKHSAKVG